MASLNITIWGNERGPEVQNDSSQPKQNVNPENLFTPEYIIVVLAALGLPGNLFVVAVCVRNMTSSTEVYMFALAVADTIACVAGILFHSAQYANTTTFFLLLFRYFATNFCVHLLAFVSIERLMAVCRPHQFNLSATRAKFALSIIAVVTFCSATLVVVGKMWNFMPLYKIIPVTIIVSCVMVMIVCYMLIAVKLLHDVKSSCRNIGVVNSSKGNATGTSADPANTVGMTRAKTARTYKGVSLLFIVTVVFIACWMPLELSFCGMPVPNELKDMFVIHSVVNPFIYCAASPMFRKDATQFCRKTLSKLRQVRFEGR